MSTLRRALGNGIIMIVAQILTWGSTIVLTAALARYLGDQGFGTLFLAMTFCGIFAILVEFGLNQQLVREVARRRDQAGSYLINSIAIKLALSVVAYLLLIGLTYALRYPAHTRLIIAIYGIILFSGSLSTTLTAIYQATEQMLHSAISTIVEKLANVVLAIVLLQQGYGVTAVAVVFVIGSWLGVGWQAYFLRGVIRVRGVVDRRTIRMLVVGALPFFFYFALGSIYYRVDVVFLSKFTNADVVGWYGAAYKLFDTLSFLPAMVAGTIMYPILSRLSAESRDDLRLAIAKGMEIILIIGVPLCTGLFVLADPIIRFIYGKPEFLHAVPALRWLAVGLLALYINYVFSVVIMSLNQETKMTLAAGLATVFNLALNLALIPHYRHVGAAGVTAATEVVLLVYLLIVLPRGLLTAGSLVVFAKAVVASAFMAAALLALGDRSLLILIPVGGIVYALSGLLLRIVPSEDIQRFKRALTHAQPAPAPVSVRPVGRADWWPPSRIERPHPSLSRVTTTSAARAWMPVPAEVRERDHGHDVITARTG